MRPDIRLIAVDLDGTLLNDRKEIPPDFVPMVEALHPRGVRFVLASGRQYFNLAAMFERIADKLFFFSENGGLVFDGAENIFCRPLPLLATQNVSAPSRARSVALWPRRPASPRWPGLPPCGIPGSRRTNCSH